MLAPLLMLLRLTFFLAADGENECVQNDSAHLFALFFQMLGWLHSARLCHRGNQNARYQSP